MNPRVNEETGRLSVVYQCPGAPILRGYYVEGREKWSQVLNTRSRLSARHQHRDAAASARPHPFRFELSFWQKRIRCDL